MRKGTPHTHGAVDGAIHRAAGRALVKENILLDGCDTGEAKISRGYNLPSPFIIHTVGPIGERPVELSSCYTRCLQLCDEYGLRSLAFCGISTGVYSYPLNAAIHVAYSSVRKWLQTDNNRDKVLSLSLSLVVLDLDIFL